MRQQVKIAPLTLGRGGARSKSGAPAVCNLHFYLVFHCREHAKTLILFPGHISPSTLFTRVFNVEKEPKSLLIARGTCPLYPLLVTLLTAAKQRHSNPRCVYMARSLSKGTHSRKESLIPSSSSTSLFQMIA